MGSGPQNTSPAAGRNTTGEVPEISVLIATRDRSSSLKATLLSLCEQTLTTRDWEIIVVDNGSHDQTREVLNHFCSSLPLTILYEPSPGKNHALNRALRQARGKILAFTDDDVQVSREWLAEIRRASSAWSAESIFCGPIYPVYPDGTAPWLRDGPYADYAFGSFNLDVREGPVARLPFGANFAVRAAALAGAEFCTQIGPNGKAYRIGGETELLRRLISRGLRVVYVPSAPVKHFIGKHQTRLLWLCLRSFCFGRGMEYLRNNEQRRHLSLRRYAVRLFDAVEECLLSVGRGARARCAAVTKLAFMIGVLYENQVALRRNAKFLAEGEPARSDLPPKSSTGTR